MSNHKAVKDSLGKKLNKFYANKDPQYPVGAGAGAVENEKVRDLIGDKFGRRAALSGKDYGNQQRLATKYLGLGIDKVMEAQKRAQDDLGMAEGVVNDFISREIERVKRTYRGSALEALSDEEKAMRAKVTVDKYLKNGGAYSEKEKAAKQKYDALMEDVAQCRAEVYAIRLAKADYMDANADLIEEERKAHRLRELRNSGLLEELNLTEAKAEEVAE